MPCHHQAQCWLQSHIWFLQSFFIYGFPYGFADQTASFEMADWLSPYTLALDISRNESLTFKLQYSVPNKDSSLSVQWASFVLSANLPYLIFRWASCHIIESVHTITGCNGWQQKHKGDHLRLHNDCIRLASYSCHWSLQSNLLYIVFRWASYHIIQSVNTITGCNEWKQKHEGDHLRLLKCCIRLASYNCHCSLGSR